jgi:GTP-binding protein
MALVDEVRIWAQAGRGGDGVIRWLRTKETARGGPAGGDGGRGGDVLLKGVRDLAALARYRYEKHFKAHNGEAGGNDNMHGADGANLVLQVPVGTSARVVDTGEEFEINDEGEEILIFKGGGGGRGNAHYKGATNQNPFQAREGREGGGGDILLTLKIIADIGLVGLPNAGKSSLLNALTNAKPKIGDYPFTTLEPNLGAFYGYVLADIPGLIEGASAGRGLGTKFLKHIEKTRILLHLVSVEQENHLMAYREVRKELQSFGKGLVEKPEIIILSKTDLTEPEDWETKQKAFIKETGREVIAVSVENPVSLKNLSDRLTELLRA